MDRVSQRAWRVRASRGGNISVMYVTDPAVVFNSPQLGGSIHVRGDYLDSEGVVSRYYNYVLKLDLS